MAFDSSVISNLMFRPDDADLLVTWSSTAPEGTSYQLYIDHRLVWTGTANRVHLPYPDGPVTIDVGAIADSETHTDLSSSLPPVAGSGSVVNLAWTGGTYLDASGLDDIEGYRVYSSTVAGGAVNYGTILATIPAYAGSEILDGFGLGGFGGGGFGRSEASYSWRSEPLAPGIWNFAVKAFDAAGNEAVGSTTSQTIAGPPNPPAANANGVRLTKSYNSGTRVVTLNWLASP